MSLPRASYLETWEYYNPLRRRSPSQTRRKAGTDEESSDETDDDHRHYDLDESVLSSSFPSGFSHRLNFNPYAGPAWSRDTAEGATGETHDAGNASSLGNEWAPQSAALKAPKLDVPVTKGAFEVSKKKRISMLWSETRYMNQRTTDIRQPRCVSQWSTASYQLESFSALPLSNLS